MCFHVFPASTDLYTPAPAIELRKTLASPVPTQTTSGFEGSTVTSPIDVDAAFSKIGSQVVPSFTFFHTPPLAVATYSTALRPRGIGDATSVTRPLTLSGPRKCHFNSAWGESATRHNTYLGRKPGRTPDGRITLKGIRMRVTGAYRPLFTALRALTVGIKPVEIAPEMGRGALDGFGWPDFGLAALGVAKVVKFRIDPGFYRSNMSVIVNLKKWNELSKEVKAALDREAVRYEGDSVAYMKALRERDEKALIDGGMRIIKLEGEAAKHYLNAANSAVWRALKKRSKNAEALRKLAFPDFVG